MFVSPTPSSSSRPACSESFYVPVWTKFTCISLVIWYWRLVALPSTLTSFVLLFYIFTLSSHFRLGLTGRMCNHVHFSFVLWFASKQIQQLPSSGCNCANVLCCRWSCVLRAPANQDASLPSASSVRSAPRSEGFPSKSTLRSLPWNPLLFASQYWRILITHIPVLSEKCFHL